jgi:hypothetical protein
MPGYNVFGKPKVTVREIVVRNNILVYQKSMIVAK